MSACTLLVRCGCAGGGKGALVSDEVSLTLSTSNTQTLFSGIEAATVAWEPLGWKPVCFAEFD